MSDRAPIIRVQVAGPTQSPSGQTTAHIVAGAGNEALLVDPAARSDELDAAVDKRAVGHVAVTHHHPDHVGAVAAYADRAGLTVWARAGRAEAFEAATGIVPDRLFRPGDRLPVAGGVEVVDTPGHAPEHVALVAGDDWLTGDLVVAAGSVVVGAPEGDMRAYLSSLRRVHARTPRRLLPAHGPVIEEPRATCERLLEHRCPGRLGPCGFFLEGIAVFGHPGKMLTEMFLIVREHVHTVRLRVTQEALVGLGVVIDTDQHKRWIERDTRKRVDRDTVIRVGKCNDGYTCRKVAHHRPELVSIYHASTEGWRAFQPPASRTDVAFTSRRARSRFHPQFEGHPGAVRERVNKATVEVRGGGVRADHHRPIVDVLGRADNRPPIAPEG